ALREDAVTVAVLGVAAPGDDEAARPRGRDQRRLLAERRVGVHLELGSERRARAVEPLREHAEVVPVLERALPRDDVVAIRADRHVVADALVRGGVGVDRELAARRNPAGVVEPAAHAEARLLPL